MWGLSRHISFRSAEHFADSLYLVLGIRERYTERLHGSDHRLHGRVDVLVDQFGVAPLVLICVSSSMDNPHLFDKGALSTLSSTCWIQ